MNVLLQRENEEAWCRHLDLDRALRALTPAVRTSVLLVGHGWSERDAASALHVTRHQLRRWLDQAFLHLRKELGEG